jgi:endoglucanase
MGAKPIHIMSAEERNKAPQLHDFYIDLGLPKEKVQEMVSVGNPVTRYQQFVTFGDMVNTKSLDNRVAVYIQIEALKSLKNPPYDVYAVFTVQEEVGLRGALVAAHHINPDFGIAIDVTVANDTPGSQPHEKITQLGKGTAIKIMDSGTICDPRMVSFLQLVANGAKIPWQPEILTAGGTDTAGIQRMSTFGAIAGAISIPLRYVHQVTEMAHQQDIAASIDLLTKACEQLDHYTWDPL